MKIKFYLLVVVLCLFFMGAGRREEPLSKIQERDGLVYIGSEPEPYTGVIFGNHEGGQRGFTGVYNRGKL